MLLLLATGPLCAQATEVIILKNGASFAGPILLETESFIDIEVDTGTVRLNKGMIAERSSDAEKMANGESPEEVDPFKPKAVANATEAALVAKVNDNKRFPHSLRIVVQDLQPIKDLQRIQRTGITPEKATIDFCNAIASGHGADVLGEFGDPSELLKRAFPHLSRGLTGYSRRVAGKLLLKVLSDACRTENVLNRYDDAKFEVRPAIGPRGVKEVEVSIQTGGKRPELVRMSWRKGRLMDLSQGPYPIPEVLAKIRKKVELLGGKAHDLVPVLEREVKAEISRSMPLGAKPLSQALANETEVWSLRPKNARYTLTLPWAWISASKKLTPKRADFLVHGQNGKVAAMAITEAGAIGLEDLKRAAVLQLGSSLGHIEIDEMEKVEPQGIPSIRLRVRATQLREPLTFEVYLTVTQSRVCQFFTWCRTSDYEEQRPRFRRFFEGLRFLK